MVSFESSQLKEKMELSPEEREQILVSALLNREFLGRALGNLKGLDATDAALGNAERLSRMYQSAEAISEAIFMNGLGMAIAKETDRDSSHYEKALGSVFNPSTLGAEAIIKNFKKIAEDPDMRQKLFKVEEDFDYLKTVQRVMEVEEGWVRQGKKKAPAISRENFQKTAEYLSNRIVVNLNELGLGHDYARNIIAVGPENIKGLSL